MSVALHTAERILSRNPDIAQHSLYTAIVCGDFEEVSRVLTERPQAAMEKGGPKGWEPLLYLCFARLPIAAARDPSTGSGQAAVETPDGFFRVFDTYVAYAATSKLGLGLDVNYVTNEVNKADDPLALQGLGLYARYQVSSPAAIAIRYERLDDEGLFGGIEQVLQETTATLEYKFADGFLLRGEFRRDWSNEAFFTSSRRGDLRTSQNTALVGLVWWFGNKQGAW